VYLLNRESLIIFFLIKIIVASNTSWQPDAKKGEGYSGKFLRLGRGVMRQLKWSQNKAETLNGKVWHVTLFTIAYYPERGYFVAPKLPGLNNTIPVNSE